MIAHSLLMLLKTRLGLLPAFKPYEAFQAALGQWLGNAVFVGCALANFVSEWLSCLSESSAAAFSDFSQVLVV